MGRAWTADLPRCAAASLAHRAPAPHSTPDPLAFCTRLHHDTCLYGVFDPHNGVEAARFILQRMAAEILFHQFSASTTDEDIRELLRSAFMSVEKAYVENYDEMIAERTSLQYELQTLPETEISQTCDAILNRLKEIDQHLSGGAAVVIALVHCNKLYVANVGEARALLCKTDENCVLRVVQLSAQHSLSNEDELLRLSKLGLDVKKLRSGETLGNQQSTRCLGNYLVKGLYRAFPDVCAASSEPVIATPELHGPITLDDSCRFLVLVSSVVYRRLQEVRGSSEQTNKQLAQIIVENFRKQTDFQNLSQAVLDEVDDQFKLHCIKHALTPKNNTPMTLIIRNFNFPMPNCQQPPNCSTNTTVNDTNSGIKGQNVRFNPIVQSKSHTLLNEIDDYRDSPRLQNLTNDSQVSTNRSASSDSTSDLYPSGRLPYDKDRKIKGYVDFTCYYENVEKARQNGTLPSFLS